MPSRFEKRVYVARFTPVVGGAAFIKIGISRFAMERRFFPDRESYRVELLAETSYYSREDALIVESNLHEIFATSRYRPPILLRSGGSSECFAESALTRILDILSGKKHMEAPRQKPTERGRKKRSELILPEPIAFAAAPEFALRFAALSLKRYGHRIPSTADRVSRYRPDVGVMFKKEEERYLLKEKIDPWSRP